MGGSVAETIRKENGEVIKMQRGTGAYNLMFFSKEFNSGEIDKAIDKHIEVAFKIKADFEKGKPYQHELTEFYGGFNLLAPTGYGLVVIDFKMKKIHTMQDYDRPGILGGASLALTIPPDGNGDAEYEFLIKNNLLNVHDFELNFMGDVHKVFGNENTYENIGKITEQTYSERSYKHRATLFSYIPKALKDFVTIRYEDDIDGMMTYVSNLKEDGFSFDAEEIIIWKEEFEAKLEDYLEDYALQNIDEDILGSFTDEELEQHFAKTKENLIKKFGEIISNNKVNSPKL